MMDSRPNILMLLTDQFRQDLLGRKDVITPHLEALAEEGVCFQEAYSMRPL